MRRLLAMPMTLGFAGAMLVSGVAHAQGTPRGFWTVPDADPAHTGWQKAETKSAPRPSKKISSYFGSSSWEVGKRPLLASPFSFPASLPERASKTWPSGPMQTPCTVWIPNWENSFGRRISRLRTRDARVRISRWSPRRHSQFVSAGPGQLLLDQRRHLLLVNRSLLPSVAWAAPAGGGYFGLRGVYVLTGDGYMHEQIMATGLDFAPPVKFFPAPGGSSFGLNINDKFVYTAAGSGCKNVADAIWSIDLNTTDYTVSSYKVQKLSLAGLTGPAVGRDGTAYITTGSGVDNPAAGVYANSVVALNQKDLKVKDWYTPADAGEKQDTQCHSGSHYIEG